MNKNLFLLLVFFMVLSCTKSEQKKQPIESKPKKNLKKFTILSPDNFFSHNKVIAKVSKQFAQENKLKLNIVEFSNSNELLKKSKDMDFDIALNLSYSYLKEIKEDSSYVKIDSLGFDLKPNIDFDEALFPYSFNYTGFTYNKEELELPPQSFGNMQDALLKKIFSFTNAYGSDFGKENFIWTIAVFRLGYIHVWDSIARNMKFIGNNLEESVSALQREEVKMISSSITLGSYLNNLSKQNRYKSFIPLEGTYRYYSCAYIPTKSTDKETAKKFLSFLLNQDTQNILAEELWAFPVVKNSKIPKKFEEIPLPNEEFSNNLNYMDLEKNLNKYWMPRWKRKMKKLLSK